MFDVDPGAASRLQAILGNTNSIATDAMAKHYQTLQNIAARKAQQAAKRQLARSLRQQAQAGIAMSTGVAGSPSPLPPSNLPRPTGDLQDWIKQALTISGHRGEHLGRGLAHMIKFESGGNPNAVNNWDSNAAAGTPSMGLMQTIQPTFDAYAMKGYNNILDPVSNIIAGLRYALSRYGADMVRQGGRRDSNGNYIGY